MPSQENIRRTLGDALAFLKNYIYIYILFYNLLDIVYRMTYHLILKHEIIRFK
jgi:hypothetical protein